MDREQQDRMIAFVCDVIDRHAGDMDAVEDALLREYSGDELEYARAFGIAYLEAYAEPGGPAFVRGMRDRRRRLVPAAPAGAPGRGFLRRRLPA